MLSKKIKHLVLALTIVFSAGMISVPALAAGTDFKGDACNGLGAISGTDSTTCPAGSESSVTNILKAVISILSIVVGILAVIMVIVGGFKFITSGGDSSKTASARSTIIYALVGLIVAAFAQILVHFVLFKASGAASCATDVTLSATSPQCKPAATATCPTDSTISSTSAQCKPATPCPTDSTILSTSAQCKPNAAATTPCPTDSTILATDTRCKKP